MSDVKGPIGIVGLGMMGYSLAKSLRSSGFTGVLWGLESNPEFAAFVANEGLVEVVNAPEQLATAELIILCVPVHVMGSVAKSLAGSKAIITDIGSVKGSVVAQVADLGLRFVPSHPIAGSPKRGPEGAIDGLFRDHVCVVCPTSDLEATHLVSSFWKFVGMRVEQLSIEQHDAALAVTSHLPHVLSFAAALAVKDAQDAVGFGVAKYSAGSFQDMIRVAGSNPDIWPEILLSNREELLKACVRLRSRLDEAIEALNHQDLSALAGFVANSNLAHRELEYGRAPSPRPLGGEGTKG